MRAIVATGSRRVVPPVPGLAETVPVTVLVTRAARRALRSRAGLEPGG